MDSAAFNGGNAEVACEGFNLETVEHPEKQSEIKEEEPMEVVQENVQEVNGDVQETSSPGKRNLRKTKANSTSTVESDAKPKMKGRKRKLSEPDISSEDSVDFSGFDRHGFNNFEAGKLVLQKLIAEAELSVPPRAKRRKHSLKSFHSEDFNAEFVKSINESESDSAEKSNNIESDELVSKSSASSVNSSTPVASVKSRGTRLSHGGSPPSTGKQKVVDMTNPAFQEPFKHGWKRELVFRSTGFDTNMKKMSDIYYITPKGKKVRSLREVSTCLIAKENLTLENFTFHKEPFGLNDPEKEIIREARRGKDAPPITKTPNKRVVANSAKKSTTKKAEDLPLESSPLVKSPPPAKTGAKATKTTPATLKIKPAKKAPQKKETKQQQKQLEQRQSSPALAASEVKENEMLPPQKNSPATRRSQQTTEKTLSPKAKRALKKKQIQAEADQRQHFMVSVCAGYHALSKIFQYLKVQELLRAARVCKMWRDLAAHPSLWKTVRMKNSQVTDWDGLAETLKRRGTQHLDLRKMLVSGDSDTMWKKFVSVIPQVTSLVKLELCRCSEVVVEEVIKNCPQLEVLSALTIKCDALNLKSVGNLRKCHELRLKSVGGMQLQGDLAPLQELTQVTHLSLTSIKELGKKKLEVLQSLVNLETLELGECSDFPEKFGTEVLVKLNKLERLRFEKGQGSCCTFDILEGVSKMETLTQLELVNFDVKNGFDKCLANCTNIKRLLIIPTYISQSATSNNMVLAGVIELSDNLTHFVWGVTLELLRVTELFVDQCNQMSKPFSGESIPVLKPVPSLKLIQDVEEEPESKKGEDEKEPSMSNPQVDILPLSQLQKLLLTALPKTRVKILKIPFNATWRQNISDTTAQ